MKKKGADSMNPVAEDILMHYGTKRHSGRYPWGSGKTPYQHSGDFLSRFESLRKQGLSEKEIADEIGLSTTDLRMQFRVANHERKQLEYDKIRSLRDDGYTPTEIGRMLGKNESSIRSILDKGNVASRSRAIATADILKKELETKGVLDVGDGVERELGCSKGTLKEALFIMETEGYMHFGVGMPQTTNNKQRTTLELIAKPDKDIKEFKSDDEYDNYLKELQSKVYNNYDLVKSVADYHSSDGGASYKKLEYPASLSSDRVAIRYGDQGGLSKDGVIEIRRGVPDLDLGDSHYAQVRILVDGTHYLKGMAMYSDNVPEGADIIFNTNKNSNVSKMDVLKKINDADPDNPFGANIKANGQSYYIDKDGKEKLSPINKLKEEGEWDTGTSRTLSSQFLSKQPMKLIKQQLDLTYKDAVAEYEEICNLQIPTVKKKLLLDFADNCDGAATHLKAAGLPRQRTQVILPIDELKDNECYAPNFRNGEEVALIRYPHGGTFEIPILKVNNNNKVAKDVLGNVSDAIGINSKVAERLSGADFDGDFVVVIPNNNKVKIKSTEPLKELIGFDPKTEYSTEGKTGVRLMKESEKQMQMGMISNLVNDMTLGGASEREIARAVKQSMVVIDAVKHKLDYKQSEKDNGIAELKKTWQKRVEEDGTIKYGGASTLISRRKQTVEVPERRGSGMIDPETGKVTYKESGRTYIDKKTGEIKEAKTKVGLLDITDDLRTLSTGTRQEDAYADYGNKMKALANKARKEYMATPNLEYSPSANAIYKDEVNSILTKLDAAAKNAPRERRANAIANSVVKAKVQDNPGITKKEIKKLSQREIEKARISVGASGKEFKIKLTDKEWDAIKAGAISDSKLTQVLRYADDKIVREKATPRTYTQLSKAQVNRIKAYMNSGYTYAEIADIMGKSVSTIQKYAKS